MARSSKLYAEWTAQIISTLATLWVVALVVVFAVVAIRSGLGLAVPGWTIELIDKLMGLAVLCWIYRLTYSRFANAWGLDGTVQRPRR